MDKKYILLIIFILALIYIYYRKTSKTKLNENFDSIKVKFGSDFYIGKYYTEKSRYHFQSEKQFIEYFLPSKYNYTVVNSDEKSDITIWDIHLSDNKDLKDDEINILVSIENVPFWNMYSHYTNYGDYNNNKIKIYMYNHITKLIKNEDYISIPMIHNYINYFKIANLEPSIYTEFKNKKFCLMVNKSNLNPEISNIVTTLESIDKIDNISMYDEEITNKSCYHSVELLNVFNKYKFIICVENSYADGYITEKIFNCLFAKTIPIYKGSEKISNYINKDSFIDARSTNYIEQVKSIVNDETLYNEYINSSKISDNYNDENYNDEVLNIIEKNIN